MKSLKWLILVLFAAGTAFAQTDLNLYIDYQNASVIAKTTGALKVGAQGAGSVVFRINDVTEGTLDGSNFTLATNSLALTAGDLTVGGGDVDLTATVTDIYNTSGANVGQIQLCIEDTCDATTGAVVAVHGIADATAGQQGTLELLAGNVADADADIRLTTGNAAGDVEISNPTGMMWLVDSTDGNIEQDAQGGDIVMSQADEGIIIGVTAIASDVGYAGYYHFGTAGIKLAQGVDDANDTHLAFYKSDATDGTADTAADSGDDLGTVAWYGADGDSFAAAAQIMVEADAATGNGDMPGRIVFSVSPDASETPAEAFRISNDKKITFTGAAGVNFQITGAGIWGSAAGLDLGLEYVTNANTACTTTCGLADGGALFGVDLAAGASQPVIVEADAATADACVCLELSS